MVWGLKGPVGLPNFMAFRASRFNRIYRKRFSVVWDAGFRVSALCIKGTLRLQGLGFRGSPSICMQFPCEWGSELEMKL